MKNNKYCQFCRPSSAATGLTGCAMAAPEYNEKKLIRLKNKIGILLAGPGSVKTKMNPYGNISTNQASNYIIDNIEYASSSAKFQFLGIKGKRISW